MARRTFFFSGDPIVSALIDDYLAMPGRTQAEDEAVLAEVRAMQDSGTSFREEADTQRLLIEYRKIYAAQQRQRQSRR